MVHFCIGGRLIVLGRTETQDSSVFLEMIQKNKVTVLNQVPSSFYNLMLLDDGKQMDTVRYLIFGGEALQPGKLSDWRDKYPSVNIVNMYGITETTVHVTYRENWRERNRLQRQ